MVHHHCVALRWWPGYYSLILFSSALHILTMFYMFIGTHMIFVCYNDDISPSFPHLSTALSFLTTQSLQIAYTSQSWHPLPQTLLQLSQQVSLAVQPCLTHLTTIPSPQVDPMHHPSYAPVVCQSFFRLHTNQSFFIRPSQVKLQRRKAHTTSFPLFFPSSCLCHNS